ncbi:MAG: hypothetical protein WA418_07425 [Bradyrhizobium sp.]
MNIPALLIAAGFGAVFLAAELRWPGHPVTVGANLVMSAFSTEHMKARAAVRNVLIDPDSAQFDGLRSVTEGAAKYVCGLVKARDSSGNFADAAFVYAVAMDFARVDDGGRMTRQQASYRPCPTVDGEPKIAQKELSISPGAIALVKTAQKLVPQGDPSTLTALATTLAPAAGPGAGGSGAGGQRMEQQISELAARTAISADRGSAGQAVATEKVAVSRPAEWRADQPPLDWPKFPAGHPLAEPAQKRSPSEALALAKDVENRWRQSEAAGDPRLRPSLQQIKEACRALLTIDHIDIEYRQAWAAFVRLQQMDRIVTAS